MNKLQANPPPKPPKVFISYAHSPERKRSVAALAAVLRSKGLTVVVDTDVKTPMGPEEGWPRWMKRQLKQANWVLMFFDEAYRRRFDGDEEPGKGRGGTYEGLIITHGHYRDPRINNKFISLLPDGTSTDLIPDEFFGYNHYYVPRHSVELAAALNTSQRTDTTAEILPTLGRPALYAKRKCSLWRLAFSFLRLDQLPSGGWGKSLLQWMEAIWEGDAGTIVRSPEMRRDGGTDFTCAAFYNYVHFIERFEGVSKTPKFSQENKVGTSLVKSLQARIDHDKGMNTGLQGRTVKPKVNLRHTAMGMISLMLYGKSSRSSILVRTELKITASYLNKHLKRWQRDESHVFAMFSALAKLLQLLESQDGIDQFARYAEKDRRLLISRIHSVLPKIQRELTTFKEEFTPLPENTQTTLMADPFFVPYGKFWRMERSGFLMYLPLLIADNGNQFFGHIQKDRNLKERFSHCFDEMLQDVKVPFDPDNPELSLVKHHRKAGDVESPRDWGLSAELAALLRRPAIRDLMRIHLDYAEAKVDELSVALEAALINTFTGFHHRPDIFKFTQSLSFSRYLDLVHDGEIRSDDLIILDRAITGLLSVGVTEDSLNDFVSDHIFSIRSNIGKPKRKIPPFVAPVRDLLLTKLQSGEYTPEGVLCSESIWDKRNKETIEFYNGPGGDHYAARYGADPVENFASRLGDIFKPKSLRGLKALDIACGPGQYAVLLKERGFDVDLYDASAKMLKYAAKSIGKSKPPRTRDYFHLTEECKADEEYDLIFASAMMVHVPLRFAQSVYQQFYRILKPGGVLFVNYKIGDHSLISLGGRYFQYYRDREKAWGMLRTAGFRIVEVIERWNNRTSNDLPREIRWVNFFCLKPEASAKDLNFSNYQRVG